MRGSERSDAAETEDSIPVAASDEYDGGGRRKHDTGLSLQVEDLDDERPMSKRRERTKQRGDKQDRDGADDDSGGGGGGNGARGGGRGGGGRGGGRSRGKTVRGSRGGAVRGGGGGASNALVVAGGLQISTAKTGRIIDALMTGQLTAEEAKTKLGACLALHSITMPSGSHLNHNHWLLYLLVRMQACQHPRRRWTPGPRTSSSRYDPLPASSKGSLACCTRCGHVVRLCRLINSRIFTKTGSGQT